jgi:hypothetical protein
MSWETPASGRRYNKRRAAAIRQKELNLEASTKTAIVILESKGPQVPSQGPIAIVAVEYRAEAQARHSSGLCSSW